MPIPSDVYEAMIVQESVAIASNERGGDFEAFSVLEADGPEPDQVFHASFINVHMVLGDPVPRLHRVSRANPEFPLKLVTDMEALAMGEILGSTPTAHHEHMVTIADGIRAACEDLEAGASVLAPPVRTLAVLAMSITDQGKPFAFEHLSRSFAEIFSGHMPETDFATLEDAPDELFRDNYELQREYRELPPYEVWKAAMLESVAEGLEQGNAVQQQMYGYMGYLLLPPEQMHPSIARLFEG